MSCFACVLCLVSCVFRLVSCVLCLAPCVFRPASFVLHLDPPEKNFPFSVTFRKSDSYMLCMTNLNPVLIYK